MPPPDTKPLPAVPHAPDGELTVASRAHLRAFVDAALAAELGALKGWAPPIERALLELAEALHGGDWLAGVKRAKAERRRRTKEAEKRRAVEAAVAARESRRAGGADDKPPADAPGRARSESATSASDARGVLFPSSSPRSSIDAETKRDRVALQQLRDVAASSRPRAGGAPRHLLLTLATPNSASAGDHTPTCAFRAGEFALPKADLFGDDPAGNEELAKRNSLFGFDEWEVDPLRRPEDIGLVGGSFRFTPVVPSKEHAALTKVLRASLYVLLSILLEQSLLSDAQIELSFPVPEPKERAARPINRMLSLARPSLAPRNSSPDPKPHGLRDSFLSKSIWGLLGKRTNSMFPNRQHSPDLSANGAALRGGSLDVATPLPAAAPPPTPIDDAPALNRVRRFSFFGEPRRSLSIRSVAEPELPLFQTVLRRLQDAQGTLSSSPDVRTPPPALFARLAERERERPGRRLTGEERSTLGSVYGWEGRRTRGAGMVGVAGFMRQQRLSVLYSEHIPPPAERPASVASEASAAAGASALRLHCGPRARMRTYAYYATGADEGEHADTLLGDAIVDSCSSFDERCSRTGCGAARGLHERRWLHNGTRVVCDIRPANEPMGQGAEYIEMWEACTECGETTPKRRMSDGTYMLSFAKFLELLFYSPRLAAPSKPPCAHTTAPPGGDALPPSRFALVRRFAYRAHVMSFSTSPITEIFELRLPRLQIMRASDRITATPSASAISSASGKEMDSAAKREQWKEIKGWWQGVAEHLDILEAHFLDGGDSVATTYHKSLPRLPSTWEESETSSQTDGLPMPSTPTPGSASLPATPPQSLTALPSTTSVATAPPMERHQSDASATSNSSTLTTKPLPRVNSSPVNTMHSSTPSASDRASLSDVGRPDALALLSNMRFALQRNEQLLYAHLKDVPEATLNDVRRQFHAAGLGALRRLAAWEAKHMPKAARAALPEIARPQWWGEGFHAVPGSNVIIKEDDWGSIIAFTLSSADYTQELRDMVHHRDGGAGGAPPSASSSQMQLPSMAGVISPALSTASESGFKFFTRAAPKLDPDDDGTVWAEPEPYSAVISRKEHPRDATALLSLREVLRTRAPTGERDSLLSGISSRFVGRDAARAKPAVDVSKAEAAGRVSGAPASADTIGKLLHELDVAAGASEGEGGSARAPSEGGDSAFVTTNIERRKTSSVISKDSGADADSDSSSDTESVRTAGPGAAGASAADAASVTDDELARPPPLPKDGAGSGFSWAGSLTSAMRFIIKADQGARAGSPGPGGGAAGLFAPGDALAIDARPHVKYDWTIGRRLKFSCTVYYAKQFDTLRRHCGLEDGAGFVQSMARSANWSADGGKSKSNFWKTADDRFIIKTLVNAWNVADLQVLIDLAPSYFRHMEVTTNRASLLAKLLGFYTVEIRNLETGAVQARTDLLVMENLFYKQKIAKTFDLKGIQGRKVKADAGASKTLFDGEWIEGQEKALTLVYPHSKAILREGLLSDCDFLAKSNIMDYSLLLGIDQERKEISCGLVDTIGSYTFAKTLEYKAKQGLSRDGKEVTVMPPNEYQERFINALDGYFLACPDKWTKPVDDKTTSYDYRRLPSVL